MKLRKETGDDTIMTEQERRKRPFKDILSEALLRPLGQFCFFFLVPRREREG